VEYFLGAFVFATCGFIFLLFYFDVSPKTFLFKVIRRFIDPPARLRPLLRDAPYRRATTEKRLHKPVLLNLQTSDGSGQACHPDVVFVPGGFGPQRWPYWMVCTPYPYQNSYFENPEIFVSCDGITWTIPEGLQNPLVPSPKNPGDHNSDPDILLFESELWLFYRSTRRSKTPREIPDENKIYLMKSADGVHWSQPSEILSEKTRSQLMSPAVIHDGTQFVMWTIEIHGDEFQLIRRTSSNGFAWSVPTIGTVVGLEAGRYPWHIDVIPEEDRLSAVLVSCLGPSGIGSRIHYAYSEDLGLTWRAGNFLFEQIYEFEANVQYRASLRKTTQDPQSYELWYSACSLTNVFSIAFLKLVRTQDTMLPHEIRPHENGTLTPAKQASFRA
jgi:hypothetical protein